MKVTLSHRLPDKKVLLFFILKFLIILPVCARPPNREWLPITQNTTEDGKQKNQ